MANTVLLGYTVAKKPILLFFLVAGVFLCWGINTLLSDKAPLIPRTVLFGPPTKAAARLSPDGKYVSYLAPLNDTYTALNIWLRSIDKDDDVCLTYQTDRSIRGYTWSPDGSQLLYINDTNGDENWRLYGITLTDKTTRCYTPFDKVQAHILAMNKEHPHTILVGLNKDNPQVHDVYKLDLISGNLELLEKNPGNVSEWLIDRTLTVRGMCVPAKDGSTQLFTRKDAQSAWQEIRHWSHEDHTLSSPLGFTYDGNSLYILDSKNANTSKLVKIDLTTKNSEVLSEDPDYDIHNVHINPDTYEVEAVSFMKDYEEWHVLQPGFKKTLDALRSIGTGHLHIMSTDTSQEKWLVCIEYDTKSAAFYLYDTLKDKSYYLFDLRPKLNEYTLAPCKPITITSRDGLMLHGYLTCPQQKEPKNLPLVLLVHGGPWVRDTWGYRPEVQWLANRGYAVLQVNYRGSTGYGKKFVNAGNKEWAGKMHDDLIDAVNWAIKSGIADPKKIAIYGASYGGYAALVGATHTPDVFCCGVDIVGPCNLITLLKNPPPYWTLGIEQVYMSVGNPDTEVEFLKERSPLFKVQNIKIPLLIAQGAQDPRVKKEEAEQIVAALKEHNIPHEYMLFEDEGHGFVKTENKQKFYAAAEKFLAQHLGGRCEQESHTKA